MKLILSILKSAFDWFMGLKPASKIIVILLAVILIGGGFGYLYMNRKINKEKGKAAIEKQARADRDQEIVDESKEKANKAETQSNEAVNKVNETENANFNNTNLSEADRLRCKAFPNSKGCL